MNKDNKMMPDRLSWFEEIAKKITKSIFYYDYFVILYKIRKNDKVNSSGRRSNDGHLGNR